MFLRNLLKAVTPKQSLATTKGPYDLVDMRTGELLKAHTETETGVPVSAETALYYHAWYRAMSLMSQKCAAVPRHLYKPSDDDDGQERAKGHYVYDLIHKQANEEQTAFQFWLQMAGHLVSRGNGYAFIYRDTSTGRISELVPADPDKTYPVRKGGKLWYVIFPFGDEEKDRKGYRIEAAGVLHCKGWGFDGLVGYPVWDVAKQEIGLGRAERKLEASRYKNSGRPSMILETDMKLPVKTKERVARDWEEMHVGLDNAGKTAILDGGLKARTINLSARDMQQNESAHMSLAAISNYTGVPIAKLGGERTYPTQEQEDRAFVNDGLDFQLNVIDDESSFKLLTEEERKQGYEIKSNREALLRPDTKTKFEIIRMATGGKPVMTQNEGRRIIDLPPSDEPDAGKLLTPLNLGQGGIDNKPTSTQSPEPGRPKTAPDEQED